MLEETIKSYFENPRTLKKIETDNLFNLILTFDNGEIKRYPMKDKLSGIFSVLQDPEKFHSVFIDEFGNAAWDIDDKLDSTIYWNNRIDICKDSLYLNSTAI